MLKSEVLWQVSVRLTCWNWVMRSCCSFWSCKDYRSWEAWSLTFETYTIYLLKESISLTSGKQICETELICREAHSLTWSLVENWERSWRSKFESSCLINLSIYENTMVGSEIVNLIECSNLNQSLRHKRSPSSTTSTSIIRGSRLSFNSAKRNNRVSPFFLMWNEIL
jgi:hypothetical protein